LSKIEVIDEIEAIEVIEKYKNPSLSPFNKRG